MVKDNKMSRQPPPPSPAPPSVTRSASDLAEDFDDLHFFPPSRSSPPTMKSFISSASSTSLSQSSSGSSGIGNEEIEIESNDFTLGSRLNIAGRRRCEYREEATHASNTTISYSPSHGHSHTYNSSNINNNHHSNSRRASHSSINRYPNFKERFRFLVKEGSILPKSSAEESIDWLSIEMVLVPEIENVLCPICLDVPFIPRFTRCGHIYCYPCLLQFFQTSEPSMTVKNNWRTCPVCAEPLHLKQLRPVKFCPATEPQEGEIFHSILIKKSIGHLQPSLPKYSNDSLNSLSPFQRLIPVNRSFVIEQILNPELNQLRMEMKKRKGEDSLELSFYESTIKQIEDLKMTRYDEKGDYKAADAKAADYKAADVKAADFKAADVKAADYKAADAKAADAKAADYKAADHKAADFKPSNILTPPSNILTPPSNQEFYYFYQSRDGLNVFLHPMCMKILKYHFDSYESIPTNLELPIIQLERVIVNSSNRKRFKYLDHLSFGTQIILVEVDLRSIVSPSTLQFHQKELSLRQGVRDQKLSRDQNIRDKSILEEWKMMEDDYYSITQATSAMDIKVPESVKLDNLDDEKSFPLPSSFNNSSSASIRSVLIKKQTATTESSPSFSALAHSWNSPFTFNSTYSGDKGIIIPSTHATNISTSNTSATPKPITITEDSPTLSLLSTSSTSSKKKILLFSTGLNLQKK